MAHEIAVRSQGQKVWVWDLTRLSSCVPGKNTKLSPCLSPPRSISGYWWIVREAWWNAGWGGSSIGLASYLGGRSSTPSPFMPWKQGWVPPGEATWLEYRLTYPSDDDFCPWLLGLLDQRSLPTITVLTRTFLTWASKLHDWHWLQVITFFVWFLCCFSVDVCQRFLQDEEILLLAVGAIQNLVRDSYVNRCRLADSDGLIILSRIYRASESEAIKTKCLHALRNLVGKYMWVIYSLLWAGIWAFHHSEWTSRMREGIDSGLQVTIGFS